MITVAEPTTVQDFAPFYRDHYRPVVGLAYVLSGSRLAAEDLAQEAFAAAYQRWNVIEGYDNPGAWVRHVAANRARSRFRRMRAERRALRRLGGQAVVVGELPEPSAEVWAAVRRLPKQQATAIALSYFADLPIDAIAVAMGCREGTVKTHLKRGRAALRSTLRLEEETP